MIRFIFTAFLGLLMFLPPAHAQQPFETISCYSGNLTVFHDSKDLKVVMGWDLNGIMRSNSEIKFLDNATVHCEGIWRGMGEERRMLAYCRFLDPDGDIAIFMWDAKGNDVMADLLEGTGKYKGMKASYKSEPLARGKPPMKGAFAGCNTLKGTYEAAK